MKISARLVIFSVLDLSTVNAIDFGRGQPNRPRGRCKSSRNGIYRVHLHLLWRQSDQLTVFRNPPFLGVYFGWRDLGFNLIRLPVAWGHIQDGCNGPLNGTTLAGLDNLVNTITGNGSTVISDIHSYARYYCAVIGQTLLNLPGAPQKVTDDHFVNLWMKLASHYKDKT
ncbi:hypothetical protein ETB97_010816 [Aspergillus alliaceus]|uniref:cellulase n=1 Tax=Petromyces alliaceus TaxID=209559 RepID=A0A8H6ABV0_PETAA|nr:hypothetical protein ETB97_010816 [Aspergillus burnettii]